MNKMIFCCGFIFVLLLGGLSFSYCQTIDIGKLVDDFQASTDLQKNQMAQDSLDKEISAQGVVENAGEYDFFDTVNDVKGTYYQVITEQQKTKDNTPYQVVFLFKDKNRAKDASKGQNIQRSGKLIKLNDERLQIAVWIYCGEMTDADKALFKQN